MPGSFSNGDWPLFFVEITQLKSLISFFFSINLSYIRGFFSTIGDTFVSQFLGSSCCSILLSFHSNLFLVLLSIRDDGDSDVLCPFFSFDANYDLEIFGD